jgi:CDP-diglyceride synthetase
LLRVIEQGGKAAPRRGYRAADVPSLQMFGIGAVFAATILLSLYLQSSAALRIYRSPGLLWAAVPLLLFWQCRLWLSTNRGWMHDDPILFAARDWVSWLTFALLGLAVLAARAINA